MKLLQYFYGTILMLFLSSSSLYPMVMDNRYFPWFPHVYNGTDHRHGCLYVEPFFITAPSAWKVTPGARDLEYGYANLQGTLDYQQVAEAFVLDGLANPIPAQWQYATPFPVEMPGSFQAQGLSLQGYAPVYKHLGVGGSIFFMRLVAQTNIVPSTEIIQKLNLEIPGNLVQFDQLTQSFESTLNTQDGYWTQSGVSDIDVYIRGFAVQEYVYWCRKIDASCALGLLIPTGVTSLTSQMASVPFGANGFWGWYFTPAVEIELKEDWKAGFEIRVQKRFARTVQDRICIADESNLFAPVVGPLYTNPGTTAMIAPYVALENIREGLGILFKYTYVVHEKDSFEDKRLVQVPAANFTNMIKNSRWAQEYATLELFYDLSFKHDWLYKPLCTLTWDIPLNAVGSRGASKTTRVAVGLMVDF